MTSYPHHYIVKASAQQQGLVEARTDGVTPINSAPPSDFGGPGDQWSPETLLMAAIANCLILSFRAIARASKLDWQEITCNARGTLDRVDGVTRFTEVILTATLRVPSGANEARAERLLEKAKQTCFITNSLAAECQLDASVYVNG